MTDASSDESDGTSPTPARQRRVPAGCQQHHVSLNGPWRLAMDPDDQGRRGNWAVEPPDELARTTMVPSAAQETIPGQHSILWYWREIELPEHPWSEGRYLLYFQAVDHAASVWLDGVPVGSHEGGETPFVLDVTHAVRPRKRSVLAIRVVIPFPDGVDGLRLGEVAHRNRRVPFTAGASWNLGGIAGDVELVLVPRVRIDDVWARSTPGHNEVRVTAELVNTAEEPYEGDLIVTVMPATQGNTLARVRVPVRLETGRSVIDLAAVVDSLTPWDLDHPALYRASARLDLGPLGETECTTRFGVRDFRLADGAFRLNGRPRFLRMTHTVNDYPLTGNPALTRSLLRRDLLHLKALGFTMVRFIWGAATPHQLDLCDELGLLVYAESFAAWPISESPDLARRFTAAIEGLIRRDRHHPSIAIWGLLNESDDQPAFGCAVDELDRVVALDDTRMVALNSGRFDHRTDVASFANPGSRAWDVPLGQEGVLNSAGAAGHGWPPTDHQPMGTGRGPGDVHIYPRVPHTDRTIAQLRDLGAGDRNKVLVSEYGIGSAVDLWRTMRQYEQHDATARDDARFYQRCLELFMVDWHRWRLADVFGHPAEFFAASQARMAPERSRGIDALRANPQVLGYGLTGAVDQVMCGEGLATTFRELKPGVMEEIGACLAPSRWCLFLDAQVTYRDTAVRFEAVLATDEEYSLEQLPILAQVFAPDGEEVWRKTSMLTVPALASRGGKMAFSALDETVRLNGSPGIYTFCVRVERGAAPTGGRALVRVVEDDPPVSDPLEVTVLGSAPALALIGARPGLRALSWDGGDIDPLRPVLWLRSVDAATVDAAVRAGRQALAAGATIVCLDVHSAVRLMQGPAAEPGREEGGVHAEASTMPSWLYLRDDWARNHPIFNNVPSGGLLDYRHYGDLIADEVLRPGDADIDAVAGAIKASQDYDAALTIWENKIGPGRLVGCTYHIESLVGRHPVADRLVHNLVRYALPVPGI